MNTTDVEPVGGTSEALPMATSFSTYTGVCPCGCGELVAVEFGGFDRTFSIVAACAKLRATGVVSYDVRNSAAPASAGSAVVRHRDGLVAFG